MTVLTFLTSIVLVSVSSYLLIQYEQTSDKQNVGSRMRSIVSAYAPLFAKAVEEDDEEWIRKLLDSIKSDSSLAYVELDAFDRERGEIIHTRGEKPSLESEQSIIEFATLIGYAGQSIGNLEIISEPDRIIQRRSNFVSLVFSMNFFLASSIAVILMMLLHTMIIKYLVHLAAKTSTLTVEHIDEPIVLPDREDEPFRNELDTLVDAINNMRSTIAREFRSNDETNAKLKSQRDFFNTVLNSCSLMICLLDQDYRILQINSAVTMQTGYLEFEILNRRWTDIFANPESAETLEQIRNNSYSNIRELTMKDQDGRILTIEWNFVPFYEGNELRYNIAYGYDISVVKEAQNQLMRMNRDLEDTVEQRTKKLNDAYSDLSNAYNELKITQSQLIKSETLASLGSLVAGISHEINTPLGIAVTAHTLIGEQVKKLGKAIKSDSPDVKTLASSISIISEADAILETNLNRAAELIKSFKQVAVDSSSQSRYKFKARENINQTILSLSNVLKKNRLSVDVDCDPLLELDSYPGALTQIYTNLVMNTAMHAYCDPELKVDDRRISIVLKQIDDNVRLEFSDNGQGIAEEILPRIFEPFVTSKRGKGGSGLGGNIVYNLTTRVLKGSISCKNLKTPQHGCLFVINFPAKPNED